MKKLILLIGFLIVFISGYSQTSVLRPRIDADLLNGQLSTYYLDTSSLAQTKAGQLTLGGDLVLQSAAIIDNAETDTLTLLETIVQVDGILNIIDLKTATTTVLTPTSTGNVDTLETSDIGDLTLASISVDSVGVNAYLIVDGVFNYAADAQGNDDYEIDIPGITALVAGLQVTFLANTANTDGATLEITSVGDLDAILKQHDTVLTSNDIEAGSIVVCVWDGSNWQMVSPAAN